MSRNVTFPNITKNEFYFLIYPSSLEEMDGFSNNSVHFVLIISFITLVLILVSFPQNDVVYYRITGRPNYPLLHFHW